MKPEQIQRIIAEADVDRDGRISLAEYINILRKNPGGFFTTL